MAEAQRDVRFLDLIVGLAAVAIVLIAVRGAAGIITQFLLAFVIVVAVAPLQAWFIRKGLPPIAAFLLTAIAVIAGFGALILVLTVSLEQFVSTLPEYQDQITSTQAQMQEFLGQFGISKDSVQASAAGSSGKIIQSLAGVATWLLSAFSTMGFMLAIAAFMLLDAMKLPEKIAQVASPERRESFVQFATSIRSYIVITTEINLLIGVIDTVLLVVMGVPFAPLWGVLAFLFGFIPSIGFLLSLIGPAIMAYLVSGPTAAAIVIVAFIVINGGIQNILMPRQMGEGTNLSPAVVFSSLVFWGWVLGPIGAILSVPMTMIVKFGLDSTESTRGLAYLMSAGKHPFETESHGVELPSEGADA